MVTVRLNAAYFPAVEMLSGVALALIVLYGGYQAIGPHHCRHGRRVRRDARVPVRTDPAALAALHHLPVGDGGAGEDLPAARHPTRPRGPPRRERARRDPRRGALRRGLLRLQPRRPAGAGDDGRLRRRARHGAAAADTTDAAGALVGPPGATRGGAGARAHRPARSPRARPSRWSAPPAPASRRWRSSSRASTTRPPGGCSSTATTCATSPATRCARRWGSCPRRRSCSAARSPRTSPSGAPAPREQIREAATRGGRRRVHLRAAARL